MARNNEFSSITGILALEVLNKHKCLITNVLTISNGIPVQRFAYSLYTNTSPNRYIKVTPSCGVLNCVRKDHLVAKYVPSKKEADYINTYLRIDGVDNLSHTLKVPLALLKDYLSSSKELLNS